MLSRSCNPGAGYRPKDHVPNDSIAEAVMGFSTQPIAPAECVASWANLACFFGAENKILQSLPCSLISRAARWPSREGMSNERTTSSGSSMYSSTA